MLSNHVMMSQRLENVKGPEAESLHSCRGLPTAQHVLLEQLHGMLHLLDENITEQSALTYPKEWHSSLRTPIMGVLLIKASRSG